MKIKLIPLLFAIILFSCKNQNSESSTDLEKQSPKSTTKTLLQDSTKNNSSEENGLSNDLTENKKLLLDFYSKNDKKPQLFLIKNNKDTTIVCSEKTRITIKANSFVFAKTGGNATDKIQISVKEYYTISDILLRKLSTTSNGKLLETGGMLDISAVSNQEKCDLKKGKNIEIEFPRKTKKDGMQLFTGSWKNNEINWELTKNDLDLNQIFSKVDEMPIYPGGVTKMYQFISRNIVLPDTDILFGKVYTSFVIDKEGNVTDIKITKGYSKNIDAQVVNALKKLPKFTPGKINGISVNVAYSLPITISTGYEDTSPVSFSKKGNSNYNDETLKKLGAEDINYYLFSSSRLGMINCDRFWNYKESPKINYVIDLKNNSETSVNIVFHRFKSIINNSTYNQNVTFDSIPSGENITIFAVKYFDDKPFLAIKKTITSSQKESNLVFQPVSIETIKNEMKKLNRFN